MLPHHADSVERADNKSNNGEGSLRWLPAQRIGRRGPPTPPPPRKQQQQRSRLACFLLTAVTTTTTIALVHILLNGGGCAAALSTDGAATAKASMESTSTATATTTKTTNSHVPLILSETVLSSTPAAFLRDPAINTTTTTITTATKVKPHTTSRSAKQSPPGGQLGNGGPSGGSTNKKVPLSRNVTETMSIASGSGSSVGIIVGGGVLLNFPPQTPASVFFANYNNQQNVMQLVRNVDTRLRNMRNVEMRVATIQEIFDNMQVGSSTTAAGGLGPATPNSIAALMAGQQLNGGGATSASALRAHELNTLMLRQDLQIFSKRLERKLQKAISVVRELRDFFQYNITKLLLHQQHLPSVYGDDELEDDLDGDDQDEDEDDEVDDEEEDTDEMEEDMNGDSLNDEGSVGGAAAALNMPTEHIEGVYLSSCIETCQDLPGQADSGTAEAPLESYNKQQIQILNYLKTDRYYQHHRASGATTATHSNSVQTHSVDNNQLKSRHGQQVPSYATDYFPQRHFSARPDNRRSLQANAFIADKIHYLRGTLSANSGGGGGGAGGGSSSAADMYEISNNSNNMPYNAAGLAAAATQAKLKFLGNHFKHIFFLSRSDGGGGSSGALRGGTLTDGSGIAGGGSSDETTTNDLNFRHLYLSAVKRKFVFLLIDVGSAMNQELLEIAKAFVSNILQLLSPTDLISIVTIAEEARNLLIDPGRPLTAEAMQGVHVATRDRREEILSALHNLGVNRGMTNHSLGFEYSFRLLQSLQNASLIGTQNPVQFTYITRGLLTNLTDAMHVLRVIAAGQSGLLEPIVINACAVVMDEKRLMHEKQFLRDISAQNYTKYEIDIKGWHAGLPLSSLTGKFLVLTKMQTEVLLHASAALFEHAFQERFLSETFDVAVPVVDAPSGDAIVSITHAVAPYGVVGVNLYLADLLEDIINYHLEQQHGNTNELAYAFLVDQAGVTISHPAFPRPSTQQKGSFPVDIGLLENSTDFRHIRQELLQQESGNMNTTVYRRVNGKTEIMDRAYFWQRIRGFYVLCLVITSPQINNNNGNSNNNNSGNKAGSYNDDLAFNRSPFPFLQRYPQKENHLPPSPLYQHHAYEYTPVVDLLYHRLDLMPPASGGPVCRYFHQVATFEAITLFLSAAAFQSPFTFLHNNRIRSAQTQVRTVETIMAYIKDSTGLLANPGLRPQIRHEVNALYNAMQQLRKRHQDSRGSLKAHIIRRYIASVNGVLQIYPGCLLSSNYDPTRRPWFRKAMQQPGRIVATEPYLDAGGAGYIVTIAHTIFEGRTGSTSHSMERDQPAAIVAMDLPYTYLYKLILDTTPLCQQHNIKCLLFENEGFLVAHPSMLEVSTPLQNPRRPHEHLTHKESYLANDILNHKMLVRKLACANFQNRTLQRYYVFNTTLTDILTNVVHGERTKYAITLIRGTNIFAAVLNSTCDGGAFCPCSTIDRICLNCKRMDQTDCECPCECPMDMEAFEGSLAGEQSGEDISLSNSIVGEERTSKRQLLSGMGSPHRSALNNYTQHYAYCEPPSEHFIALPTTGEYNNMLPPCININCDVYGTQTQCLAVMGCVWCQQDLDGNTFSAAFCAAQSACFNGVLSSLTPYGELDDAEMLLAAGYNPGQKQSAYSTFGPIGGALIVLAMVIGGAIYCYRNNVDGGSQEQFYIDSMQEENYGLPLSRFNFDDCQAHDEPPGLDHGGAGGAGGANRNLIHPADISPYHMSTGSSYRRPPNGESDHGYSTMTPHEDSSDHQCFTLAEPLLLNDKRHSKSDTLSISTSISSPTNRHHSQQQGTSGMPPLPANGGGVAAAIVSQLPLNAFAKDSRYTSITSPTKKYHHHNNHHHQQQQQQQHNQTSVTPSPGRNFYEQTILPLNDSNEDAPLSPHYILAPVTVHRHMETTES